MPTGSDTILPLQGTPASDETQEFARREISHNHSRGVLSVMTNSLDDRYSSSKQILASRGQSHVLRWWEELSLPHREQLIHEVETIPWEMIGPILESSDLVSPSSDVLDGLAPPPVYPHMPAPEAEQEYEEAKSLGCELLRTGRVALFMVAGGQGTRLGYDGPKGEVIVTPVGERSLFAFFAECVLAARVRYQAAIPWYIMTSPGNHERTVEYFESNAFFGLPKQDVSFFSQAMLPAFDGQGRLLLGAKHGLALSPDGHGGSLKALVAGGALADMRKRGVEVISYIQVDNPLVKPFDPLFIGLHKKTGAEMSAKVLPKVDDLERVGNLCTRDGRVVLIEYSDFPESLAHERNVDGSRKFDHGNPAIHAFSVEFIERVVERSFQLPLRRAKKIVPFVNDEGQLVAPAQPNAVKLEMFVFDVLPLADRVLLLEIQRADEFSPVKNASGVDSLESAQRDLVRRAYRWLEDAGVSVPYDHSGEPGATVVISPTLALESADLAAIRDRLPSIKQGDSIYLQ